MQLGQHPLEREPVVFDPKDLPEGFEGKEGGMRAAFGFGRVAFNDTLQTAVAVSGSSGITDEGYLNMDRLSAVQETAEYLDGRQGQEVVIVQSGTPQGDITHSVYSGHVATLGASDSLVGILYDDRNRQPIDGIAVQNGYTSFHQYRTNSDDRLRTQYLPESLDARVIPLADRAHFTFGKAPDWSEGKLDIKQEVVAGPDIVPWISKTFPETMDAYHFYTTVIDSLVKRNGGKLRPEQMEHLDKEPFTSMMADELGMLQRINRVTHVYDRVSSEARGTLANAKTAATANLAAIGDEYPQFADRVPRTFGSYPATVTSTLVDPAYGEQVEDRFRAIDYHTAPLRAATAATRQR